MLPNRLSVAALNGTSRRQWMGWGLAVGGSVLLPAISGCEQAPRQLDKLTVAHAYQPSFGLLYLAEKAGLFKEEGLEVEFQRYSFGRETLLATLDGKADVATPFDTPVALAMLKREPVRVLSSLSVLLGNAQVMGNKARGVRAPADLKDKRIGFINNTSGEFILSMVMANAGIANAQVTLVPMSSPADLTQALIKGGVDAAALWAPFTHQARSEMGADALTGFTSPTYVETALLTTTEDVLKNKRQAIGKLMRGLVKAESMALREPQKAVRAIQESLPETPPAVVKQAWESLQPQIRLDNQMNVSLEYQIQWFLKKQGRETEQPPNIRLQLADEVLRGIQPQAVTLSSMR